MPAPTEKVLAFDIGIRNLAWCLMEGTGQERRILGWQNYDLLTGKGAEAAKEKTLCSQCSAAGAFWTAPRVAPAAGGSPASPSPVYTCLRHCPADRKPLRDLSGSVPTGPALKKLPGLPLLRTLAATAAINSGTQPLKKSATRVALVEFLAARHSLPVEKVKLKKAVEHELTTLHDAIRTFVLEHTELFRQATHILLENQPVLKNPTMKSVQILLFATLRDVLQPVPPPLKLVHAGKKVKAEVADAGEGGKGDAGYKTRKDASEAKVIGILERAAAGAAAAAAKPAVEEGRTRWLPLFRSHSKKSDLADAFCMCWDRLEACGGT